MLLLGTSRLCHTESAKPTSYITSSQEICILYITVRPTDVRRQCGIKIHDSKSQGQRGINRRHTDRLETHTHKHPIGINIQKIKNATSMEREMPVTAPNL